MANIFKKLTGVSKLEQTLEQQSNLIGEQSKALQDWQAAMQAITARQEQILADLAVAEAEKAQAENELAKIKNAKIENNLSDKDRATRNGEPWFDVVKTQVNEGDVKRGYFELDWNELFIEKLKQDGYGYNGDTEESIVNRWFKELCATVVIEEDIDVEVESGTLDLNNLLKRD